MSPSVKSLVFPQRISDVSSEKTTQSPSGIDPRKPSGTDQRSDPFSRFRSEPPPSYSALLKQITSGKVKELQLVPARREVIVTYPDGRRTTVAILANDQQILRTAEAAGTPLRVKDVRQEQALAGLAGNLAGPGRIPGQIPGRKNPARISGFSPTLPTCPP